MSNQTRNSTRDDGSHLTPEEQARLEALLAAAAPDPERELPPEDLADRLRAQFADGSIQPGRYLLTSKPERSGWRSAWPAFAAAAVLVACLLGFMAWNRGPDWAAARTSGTGSVFVDGENYSLEALEASPDLLEPGTVFHTAGDVLIDFELPGVFAIQATPCSEMTLPNSPGRLVGRTSHFAVEHGEVRVTTLPEFSGRRLLIDAPIAEVAVLGTTIAVIGSPDSTCVCVLDGEVLMTTEGETARVEAGQRRTVWSDPEREALVEPISQMERMKLQMLRDAATGPPPQPE